MKPLLLFLPGTLAAGAALAQAPGHRAESRGFIWGSMRKDASRARTRRRLPRKPSAAAASRSNDRAANILGTLVPYGKVWRTGADAATVLSLDKPLTIGEKSIPAGRYSVWTLPTAEGVELLINRQYGPWGTEYHPERDR